MYRIDNICMGITFFFIQFLLVVYGVVLKMSHRYNLKYMSNKISYNL